jgi:hypothetical protein
MSETVGCEVIVLYAEHSKGITRDLAKRIELGLAGLSRQGYKANATQIDSLNLFLADTDYEP